jgi:hypothetical protein
VGRRDRAAAPCDRARAPRRRPARPFPAAPRWPPARGCRAGSRCQARNAARRPPVAQGALDVQPAAIVEGAVAHVLGGETRDGLGGAPRPGRDGGVIEVQEIWRLGELESEVDWGERHREPGELTGRRAIIVRKNRAGPPEAHAEKSA